MPQSAAVAPTETGFQLSTDGLPSGNGFVSGGGFVSSGGFASGGFESSSSLSGFGPSVVGVSGCPSRGPRSSACPSGPPSRGPGPRMVKASGSRAVLPSGSRTTRSWGPGLRPAGTTAVSRVLAR
jgi:hypothetical protein